MPWKPIPLGPYKLAGDGLLVVKKPTLDDAEEAIVFLQDMEELTPFYLGDLWSDIKTRSPETYAQVLDHLTQTEGTLDNYQWVAESIPKEKRLFREGVPFAHHQTVAALPPKERDRILKKAKEQKLKLSEVRMEVRKLKRQKVSEGAGELKGTFRVIYADPPWPYDDQGRMPDGARSTTADHYETMTLEKICEHEVKAHAQPDSVLFLWVPVPLLPDAFPVIDAWGFTYKNEIVWDKVRHMMGHYVSNRHENLLIATRGSCAPDRLVPMIDNVQTIKAEGEHSQKPEEFRQIIERLYDGPYLELFARKKTKGWTAWGDQLGVVAA
jgi:N6-adenosine-specific RNA methylase IME4